MTERQNRLIAALNEILDSEDFVALFDVAADQNEWFTWDSIDQSVQNIKSEMLDRSKVSQWLGGYDIPGNIISKKVGIVMAGNIPLVGFFDLLCVLIIGCEAVVKPSSKDYVLVDFIIKKLRSGGWMVKSQQKLDPNEIDILITMGGVSAAEYYGKHFGHLPCLIRSDRRSLAILTGAESVSELELLLDDMFSYWGLGCRNISKLFVPKGYDFYKIPCFSADFKPFNDNYRYLKALYTMMNRPFIDKEGYVLLEGENDPSIGAVGYSYYDNIEDIKFEDQSIQCIVAEANIEFARVVKFGETQRPSLYDYPDSMDILKFLLILQN